MGMARGSSRRRRGPDPNQLTLDFLWGSNEPGDEPTVEERSDEPVRSDGPELLPGLSPDPVQPDREPGGVLPGPRAADPGPDRRPDAGAGGRGPGGGELPGEGR